MEEEYDIRLITDFRELSSFSCGISSLNENSELKIFL